MLSCNSGSVLKPFVRLVIASRMKLQVTNNQTTRLFCHCEVAKLQLDKKTEIGTLNGRYLKEKPLCFFLRLPFAFVYRPVNFKRGRPCEREKRILLTCAGLDLNREVMERHNYYPGQKKEPSSRFAARRTLFHVWYHARSGAISAGQKSRTVADQTCPSLIAPDRAWYHTWNSVLLAANLDDGSFFCPG